MFFCYNFSISPSPPRTLLPLSLAPRLTHVAVAEQLEQARLLSAGGSGQRGGQLAQIQLPDVQRNVCGRAHLQVRHAHGVITWGHTVRGEKEAHGDDIRESQGKAMEDFL